MAKSEVISTTSILWGAFEGFVEPLASFSWCFFKFDGVIQPSLSEPSEPDASISSTEGSDCTAGSINTSVTGEEVSAVSSWLSRVSDKFVCLFSGFSSGLGSIVGVWTDSIGASTVSGRVSVTGPRLSCVTGDDSFVSSNFSSRPTVADFSTGTVSAALGIAEPQAPLVSDDGAFSPSDSCRLSFTQSSVFRGSALFKLSGLIPFSPFCPGVLLSLQSP